VPPRGEHGVRGRMRWHVGVALICHLTIWTVVSNGWSAESNQCSWVPLGPFAVPNGEGFDGSKVPVSGRVTGIAVAGDDEEAVYVGTALGGLWVTRDRGKSWEPLTDSQDSLAVGAVAVNPGRPGEIYVGTGEGNLAVRRFIRYGDRPISGDRGIGLLRSTDGGASWSVTGRQEFFGEAFFEFATTPADPSLLFAATTAGLFQSRDRGQTWHQMEPFKAASNEQKIATSIVLDPNNPSIAYAGFWGKGVFRSSNANSAAPSWEQLKGGLPLSNISRISLARSPVAPFTIGTLIADADSNLRGFYVSDDAGDHWSKIDDTPDIARGQGFYNLAITAHPREPKEFFVAGSASRETARSSLFRITQVDGQWRVFPIGPMLHIDFHALTFSARGAFYVGNDGGIWRTDDDAKSWRDLNNGLSTMQFYKIDQHPISTAFLIGGTQDNGTLLYQGSPVWTQVDTGDGGSVLIDPQRPEFVYNEFFRYFIARSTRGGTAGSFRPIYPRLRVSRSTLLAPFAINPSHPEELLLGLERLYLSTDRGETWSAITIDLTQGPGTLQNTNAISTIEFASSDLIYVGTSDGRVWRVSRTGSSWEYRRVDAGEFSGAAILSIRTISDKGLTLIGLDRGAPNRLWRLDDSAVDGPGILTSAAAGLPDSAVFSVEYDTRTATLYVGTDRGVYSSTDIGRTWVSFNEAMPKTSVFDIKLHSTFPLLRAATHGRGVWERDLSGERCRAVEIYVRDHPMDQGREWRTLDDAAVFRGTPLDSPDIKVFAGEQKAWELTADSFAAARDEIIHVSTRYQIGVHVQNRGNSVARDVTVTLYLLDSAKLLEMRASQLEQTPGIELVGVGQIKHISNSAPGVTLIPWEAPANFEEGYLIAVAEAVGDRLSPNRSQSSIDDFIRSNRKVAARYLSGR
jgi:photosystem II stability/assembly factor-like uncharacterized protein